MRPEYSILKTIITRGLERFGVYYSIYRGLVVNNKDPKFLNRVKLQVPQVFGDSTLEYWAWPRGIRGAKNSGFQMIPDIGEMVWVTFEFGNPRRPVWEFGYRGVDDFMDPELKDYGITWYKTKGGHKVIIDDANSIIKLLSKGGKHITISDKISIGTDGGSDQAAVLGGTLEETLEAIIDALSKAKVTTMLGPQPFLPDTLSKLLEIKSKLSKIKSETVTIDK